VDARSKQKGWEKKRLKGVHNARPGEPVEGRTGTARKIRGQARATQDKNQEVDLRGNKTGEKNIRRGITRRPLDQVTGKDPSSKCTMPGRTITGSDFATLIKRLAREIAGQRGRNHSSSIENGINTSLSLKDPEVWSFQRGTKREGKVVLGGRGKVQDEGTP